MITSFPKDTHERRRKGMITTYMKIPMTEEKIGMRTTWRRRQGMITTYLNIYMMEEKMGHGT